MISIITPTFNRSYTLDRLYHSLVSQTNKNFEWIIVDDGSTDNTQMKCEKYIQDNIISCRYFRQLNKGKPSAVNGGVKKANFDYIFIVDSDDALVAEAINIIHNSISQSSTFSEDFSGFGYRKATLDGVVLGDSFHTSEKEPIFLTSTECKNTFRVDLAFCFKKKLLLENPFPVIEDEKFVPELYIWNKITDIAKVCFYPNEIVYLCEYLPDGLTNNFSEEIKRYPIGFSIYYKDQFFREKTFFQKLKMAIRYSQCCYYKKKKYNNK